MDGMGPSTWAIIYCFFKFINTRLIRFGINGTLKSAQNDIQKPTSTDLDCCAAELDPILIFWRQSEILITLWNRGIPWVCRKSEVLLLNRKEKIRWSQDSHSLRIVLMFPSLAKSNQDCRRAGTEVLTPAPWLMIPPCNFPSSKESRGEY